jgi:hypothetical protein
MNESTINAMVQSDPEVIKLQEQHLEAKKKVVMLKYPEKPSHADLQKPEQEPEPELVNLQRVKLEAQLEQAEAEVEDAELELEMVRAQLEVYKILAKNGVTE